MRNSTLLVFVVFTVKSLPGLDSSGRRCREVWWRMSLRRVRGELSAAEVTEVDVVDDEE